jgi:hypothetical protein
MIPRQTRTALYLACAATLALGGCQDKAPDEKAAGGEVLPRSTTDDMLPYDTVRSEPPLAEPEAIASGAAAGGAIPVDDASEAAAAAGEAAEEARAVEAVAPDE